MKLICPLAKYFARSKDIILELLWQLYVMLFKLKYKKEICLSIYFDSSVRGGYSVMISRKKKSKTKENKNRTLKKRKTKNCSLA